MRSILLTLWLVLVTSVASAQPAYQIKAGDVLRIEVLEDPQLNREVLILPDGRFSFPFAGSVLAGGRTISEVEQAITDGIASNFAARPNVFVSVGALRPREQVARRSPAAPRTIDIYMLGEVNAPGQLAVSPGTTLLQALAQAGGISRFGAAKRVQVRRTDKRTGVSQVFRKNVKAIMDGAISDQAIVLKDGDVIVVPERRLFE